MRCSSVVNSQRVLTGGAVLTPVLLVMGIRGLIGGPGVAPAAVGPQMPDLGVFAPNAPATEKELKALEWTRDHQTVERGSTPMDHAEPPPTAPVLVPVTETTEAPKPEADPLAGLVVTTIMGHDETGFVSAMGKVFRFGEEIVPGWKISAIDARLRHIDVSCSTGETRRVSLKQ